MSLLTVLAGNYLGSLMDKASSVFNSTSMGNLGFDKVLQGIEVKKLGLEDMQLSAPEKADILDLISLAKQAELEDIELEIHGRLYSLNTDSLELSPILRVH